MVQVSTCLANIDKSAHEVLVTEGSNSVLSLLPGRIFHNTSKECDVSI